MSTIDYTNISDEEYIEISSRVLASWASKTLEPVIYGSGASRALKDLKKKAAGFFAAMRDHFSREHLNRKRALAIGFKPWSEDAPKLLLIPLWYCGMLKDGQEVVTIGGSIEKYSRETTDHDMRFGVVPFGFEFEDPRKDAQAQDGGEGCS